jgi:hypothetical protein
LVAKPLEPPHHHHHHHLRSREGDARITLRWILERLVMRIGAGWNWLRIIFNGRLWY